MSSVDRAQAIGFIGLGMMGGPMAENILKKAHPLIVCDIDKSKVARFVELGAHAATGPADVATRAQTVISMVDTTAQAEEVIVGPGGIIDTAQPGDVVISMSTIDPMALRRMHPKLAAKGIDLIDAPVSGMEKGAIAGTLNAYVGGDPAALERARPALAAMTSAADATPLASTAALPASPAAAETAGDYAWIHHAEHWTPYDGCHLCDERYEREQAALAAGGGK